MAGLFAELPLADLILPICSLQDIGRLEQACRGFLRESRGEAGAAAWRALLRRRWGAVALPPDRAARAHLCHLEENVAASLVRTGCRQTLASLEYERTDGVAYGEEWHETVRALLSWTPLKERRRLAAFVCADWQPASTLHRFLAPYRIAGETPLDALRTLLLVFPFLPIDAGEGADRVISYFARAYARQAERSHLARLGLSPPADAPADEKRVRDGAYTLTYSMIMLNTDLHNPAVQPKMSADEYAASVRRCAPMRHAPDDALRAIYADLLANPLQIAPNVSRVHSVIRSTRAAEQEEGAQYSVYSSVPRAPPDDGDVYAAAAAAAARAAARNHRRVALDWRVAYWNVVDAGRYARAQAGRTAVRLATSRRFVAIYGAVIVVLVAAVLRIAFSARAS